MKIGSFFDSSGIKKYADDPPFFYKPNRLNISTVFFIFSILPLYILIAGRVGYKIFFVLGLSVLTGLFIESAGAFLSNRKLSHFGIITWMVFPLLIPPGIKIHMILISLAAGIIIAQVLFGGYGKQLFNPAVVSLLFMRINFSAFFSKSFLKPFGAPTFGFFVFSSKSLTGEPTLALLKSGTDIPLIKLLFGPQIGNNGEILPLVLIFCGLLYLILCEVDYRTPIAFLLSFVLFSFLGNLFLPAKILPVLPSILSGSVLLFTFFIFSDRWTAAKSKEGRIVSGIIAALITILIRYFSLNIEGIAFAAIINYSFIPLYDECVFFIKKKTAKEVEV